MLKQWRFWLGMAVSVGLAALLFYRVDFGEVAAQLGQADYTLVIPAILIYFLAVYFRAWRWQYLLKPVRHFPVGRLYSVVVIGYMANNLLPARLGDVARAYYLSQRENCRASSALATVAVERVYDGVTLLALAVVAGPWLVLLGQFSSGGGVSRATVILLSALSVIAFVGALTTLILLAASPLFAAFIDRLLGLLPARLQPRARSFVAAFTLGLRVLKSPRQHLSLFLRSLPVWMVEGSMYLMVAYSFGIDQYFSSFWILLLVVALLTATSNIATSIPSVIGGIGPFEVVAQQTLIGLGVGAAVATAYAGFLHIIALWLPVNLVGLALLWKQNLSFKTLLRRPSETFSGAGQPQEKRA